jgi:hypothetical protein
LRLFGNFVNGKSPVSIGILPFFQVFMPFSWISAVFSHLWMAAKPFASAARAHFQVPDNA